MRTIDRLPASGTDWRASYFLDRRRATVDGYRGPAPAACPEFGGR